MKRQYVVSIIALLIVASFSLFPFQNCSDVSFQKADQSSNDDTKFDVKVCTDSNGQTYAEGQQWEESAETTQAVPCFDAPEQMQRYLATQRYLCHDGQILDAGVSVNAIPPMATCPIPELSAKAEPAMPKEGEKTKLIVTSANLKTVGYQCVYSGTTDVFKEGSLNVGTAEVEMTVTRDLFCLVTAETSNNIALSVPVEIPVDCGNRLKENGVCRDFACQTIQPLTAVDDVYEIPKRTIEGICYAIKLMDAIPNGSSSLTKVFDNEVISRNHDGGAGDSTRTRNPYQLGKALVNFKTIGLRTVKLAGSGDSLAPIRVDNFIVTGLYPKDTASPGNEFFRAYGTKDSTINNSENIQFRDQPLFLKGFESGGTSTVAPLDITTSVLPDVTYQLDARALDCGGSRELSNIYLLFQ